MSVVTETYNLPLNDIIRQIRKQRIVEARQVVAYCLRLLADLSFPVIGSILGGRDHTTAMHSCSKIAQKIEENEKFRLKMESILGVIRNPEDLGLLKHLQSELEEGPIEESVKISEEPEEPLIYKTKEEDKEDIVVEKEVKNYIIPKNLDISDREKNILTHYRQGMSLNELSRLMGVTRERIRQIAFKAMLKEVGIKIKAGYEIDINEYMKGEKITHELSRYSIPWEKKSEMLIEYLPKTSSYLSVAKFAKDMGISTKTLNQAFPEVTEVIEKNFQEKKNRWSRFYTRCRGCGTTKIPHIRQGYCEQCVGVRRGKRRESIFKENNICGVCSIERGSAILKYGRDLYIMKNGRVLCRGCFLQLTGRKLSESRRDRI